MENVLSGSFGSSVTSGVFSYEGQEKSFKTIYYPHDQSGIIVSEPRMHSTLFSKHICYLLTGKDSLGKFESQRRYKEFFALRKSLISQWPGCSIPLLPPKQTIVISKKGNLETSFVESRRSQLEFFIRKVASNDFLYSSEEVQTFLRGGKNFHKSELASRAINFKNICEKYQIVFEKYLEYRRDSEVEKEIGVVLGHLNYGISNLENVSKLCCEQSVLIQQDTAGIARMVKGINDIKVYLEDSPSKAVLKNIDDPFSELNYWCKNTSLMISGTIESIFKQYDLQKYKSQLINKIELEKEKIQNFPRKSKIFKLFQKKPTEFYIGKSETEIKNLTEMVESLQIILDITSALVLNLDYPNFKNEMKSEYMEVLRRTYEKYDSSCSILLENFKLILI